MMPWGIGPILLPMAIAGLVSHIIIGTLLVKIGRKCKEVQKS
jgi:hypothetical protein